VGLVAVNLNCSRAMPLSETTTALLLELVEDRLGTIEVFDREDQCEVMQLKRCAHELTVKATGNVVEAASLFSMPRRPGRPRNVSARPSSFVSAPAVHLTGTN
jgi:hypothetical protein